MVFTGGARRFVFEVTDADGAVAVARSTVTVSEMRRVGDPSRDENQASPPECSGAGYRDVDDELGTGDPEACVCDPGFEGDRCELHPCNDRGELVFFDAQTGEKTCECRREFGGATCDVECRGNGAFDPRTETCACHPGFAGILCDVACDGCDGAHGRCALTNASAASWSDADEAYEIVETTCECSDEYMGANCTIPCPCAPGAFGRGACVVDALKAAGAYGDVPDEELGACACDPGWVGEDCSVPCPACVANQGDCAPPPGFEKGVGRALADVDADVTHASEAARRAALDAARVEGICACRETQTNDLGGEGYAGADCSVPCAPCAFGTCADDGSCACAPGFVGDACDVECSGNGVLVFPEFNATNDVSAFDALPGVPGNERMETSGLIHAATLYGATSYPGGENRTFAYCACGFARDAETGEPTPIPTEELGVNARGGVGYVGVFCETPCDPCDAANGKCVFDGAAGACECRRDAPNAATSASRLVAEGETGFGFTGPACDVPCEPCYNGTCSNEPGSYGQCLCDPGFADPACLIECGDPGFARVADVVAGADDGASFGQSIVDISQGGVYDRQSRASQHHRRGARGGSARHDDDVRVRVHVDGAVVFARVSLPVRRRARRVRGERPGRRGLRQSVDHGDRVRTRLDGAPGGIPSPAVRRAESRKKLQRAVSPVRARDVPRRRDVPVRVRIRVAGTAVRGVGRGRDRSRPPVPAGGRSDGGVRAGVSHVRGEAPVQHERRTLQRHVRPGGVAGVRR